MNNKFTPVLISLITLAIAISFAGVNPARTMAQIRGEDSQEFFGEGDREMDQEIQILEDEQSPESTEEREEQGLVHPFIREGQNLNAPETESIPSGALEEGDNLSTPPSVDESESELLEQE